MPDIKETLADHRRQAVIEYVQTYTGTPFSELISSIEDAGLLDAFETLTLEDLAVVDNKPARSKKTTKRSNKKKAPPQSGVSANTASELLRWRNNQPYGTIASCKEIAEAIGVKPVTARKAILQVGGFEVTGSKRNTKYVVVETPVEAEEPAVEDETEAVA